MHRGSRTGVGGRKFAGYGYVEGGVRGILAGQHFSLLCGDALRFYRLLLDFPQTPGFSLVRRVARGYEMLKC